MKTFYLKSFTIPPDQTASDHKPVFAILNLGANCKISRARAVLQLAPEIKNIKMQTKDNKLPNSFKSIIPVPAEILISEGTFNPSQLGLFYADDAYLMLKKELVSMCALYNMKVSETIEKSAHIILKKNLPYSDDEWSADISDMKIVPEWRVLSKITKRLPAYSKCAWALKKNKEWSDFQCRKNHLESAGFNFTA